MKIENQRLLTEQTDQKLAPFKSIKNSIIPEIGWVLTIRTALNMSLRQLGDKMKMSPQGVKDIEKRESEGNISINALKQVAEALEMRFVYGFIPKEDTLEKMIEKRAAEMAREIVLRTSATMQLEDQENSEERIAKAIKAKTEEIKNKMPKYLWD